MLTKPDMWESEEFRRKFSKIPKSLQAEFLKAIQELYRQESETMLRFIQMSRQSLRSAGIEIRDEQNALQVTSRKLSAERRERKAKQTAQPRRHKTNAVAPQTDAGGITSAKAKTSPVPVESDDNTDDDEQFFKEETEEIFRATSRADNVHANERARQMEKIEKLKRERRAKKEADKGKAEQLIREASALELQRSEEKKKQEDVVKEKLEKRRKKKSDHLAKQEEGEDGGTEQPDLVTTAPDPPTNDPDEEEAKKDKKKKKKKDKKKKKKKKEEDEEEGQALPTDSPV